MNLEFVGILVAILIVDSTIAGDPTLVIKYKQFKVDIMDDNPYFDKFSVEISDVGELTLIVSIKKSFSETLATSVAVEMDGNHITDYEAGTLCEQMNSEIFTKSIVPQGLPVDKFPKSCPIVPGDYKILKYVIPKDEFPVGIPNGNYDIKAIVGEPDMAPFMKVHSIVEISHDIPKLPVPGLGR